MESNTTNRELLEISAQSVNGVLISNQNQQMIAKVNPYPTSNPQFQGVQPGGQYNQGFMQPPPPPQQAQIQIKLPPSINATHPYYRVVVDQCSAPCPHCSSRGTDIVRLSPGCAASSWAVFLFCFTGIFFFWIPLVMDSCKDVVIMCSRCLRTKYIVKKPCC